MTESSGHHRRRRRIGFGIGRLTSSTLLIAWLAFVAVAAVDNRRTAVHGDQVHIVVAAAAASSSGPLQHEVHGQLQPPHSVKVEAKAEHSFTLSWQAPHRTDQVQESPTGYSIHWSTSVVVSDDGDGPSSTTTAAMKSTASPAGNGGEHTVSVPADRLEALVSHLQPDTEYTVRVVAIYAGNRSASSLPFVVSTLSVGRMDNNAIDWKACDCDVQGTSRCVPHQQQQQQSEPPASCVCRDGHGGRRCDLCVVGHYMGADGRCTPCDCPRLTSSGTCVANVVVERGRECSCRPGHRGADCDQCSGDYFPHGDQCLHCNCLVLCPMDKGRQHCRNCSLLRDAVSKGIETCREFSSHVRLRQQRITKPSDGTVAVIAVLLSLAFIASVAIGLWCYRNKYHNQNRNSLWSMELHEEKISLNSSCDYQRLDAAAIGSGASKRTPSQSTTTTTTTTTTAMAATTVAAGCESESKDRQQQSRSISHRPHHHHQSSGGRHSDPAVGHKYHCISI